MLDLPDQGYYVYTLSAPDGTVFYVGKGCRGRILDHEREARRGHRCYKCNKIRKIWRTGGEVKPAIVFTTPSEAAAYNYEAELIGHIGLTNLTNTAPGAIVAEPRIYPRPNKPLDEYTDQEYRGFLDSLGLSKPQRNQRLRSWRASTYKYLRSQWAYWRRRRMNDKADQVMARMQELADALGWVDQDGLGI